MKLAIAWIPALVLTSAVQAQLQLLPDANPQAVFGGGTRTLVTRWHNAGILVTNAKMGVRLIQASSTTAVVSGQKAWKNLGVLPGQTILETVAIDFPGVRAETQFFVQWIEGASNVVGRTAVLVYPMNSLARLKALVGNEPLGIFDPANQLKPLLQSSLVEFQDLIEDGTDKFRGKLAIFGPFESKTQMRKSLSDDIRALAKRGVAVVWLMPSPKERVLAKPSFYFIREGECAVVMAHNELVALPAERPGAQLCLLRLAEEALHPTPLDLPETKTLY